ncbi:dihydroxyacetone kinase subunit L [Vallitalea pronyensis]|uniref:phosphoenolpyruvate--glycerone phosphotransferase n=1 Tax=Vallitalea pronyensis TaxID=1348613 RepID=A0A8J8MN86_9FIRM|nr:dihydroxyacetone kinase subunit DhaL [Vallitalea pronyensis]QUI24561.1 dihydroxyacetone kinase subunit L [Vallitalea pronyensis]
MLDSIHVKALLIKIADMFIEKQDELAKLDAVIGDGDHGVTMARGAKAAKAKVEALEEGTCRDYFKLYGRTLVSTLGGAMGPLFGSIFLELSKACKGQEQIGLQAFTHGLKNGMTKVMDLGGAKPGDKTMVDAMDPVVLSMEKSLDDGKSLQEALSLAAKAGEEGVNHTIPLIAKRGRSRYLQEKAIGHQDAGATSYYYLIKTIGEYVQEVSA